MNNEQKIQQLETLKGQLVKIENVLENELKEDDYFDMCDHIGSVAAFIKKAIKKLKEE